MLRKILKRFGYVKVEPQQPREIIMAFANEMEANLTGLMLQPKVWRDMKPFALASLLQQQLAAVVDAVYEVPDSPEVIRDTATDLAIYAMFVADNWGELAGEGVQR